MDSALQLIVSGLTIGCTYSLIGLAFALLIRATGILNFAQGEIVMLGAFTGMTVLIELHLPYPAAFVIATLVGAIFGVLMERAMFGPMLAKRPPMTNLFIATLGLRVILKTGAMMIWGVDPQAYPTITAQEPFEIAGLLLRPQNLIIFSLGIAVMVAIQFFLHRTVVGIAWRAASLDPDTAALYGVNRNRNIALTFALSSSLGAAAGVLVGPLFFVSAELGNAVQMKSFFAATIGGFGTTGTMIGGLVVGLVETLSAYYISTSYKDVILNGILLIILLFFFRPKAPEGRSAGESPKAMSREAFVPPKGRIIRYLRMGGIVVGILIWVALPYVADLYTIHIIALALIYGVAALGLQLIFGYTGMLSLGHAAFFGVGAYTYTLLALKFGLPFWVTIPLAAVTSGLGGAIMAPIIRLSGVYFVVGTAAFNYVVYQLMINLRSITNGPYGIYNVPQPTIAGFTIESDVSYYFLITIIIGLVYYMLRQFTKYRFGRSLVAVRENELCSVMSGVNALGYRMKAFVIGAACAGVAGAIYAPFIGSISPLAFTVNKSIDMITMAVIGGLGNLLGGAVGAATIILAPEYLRFMEDYRLIVYGAILILFMMFAPGGVVELATRPIFFVVGQMRKLAARLEKGDPGADAGIEARSD
jgi:branched-chain amino acid transport system permease protein